MVKTFDNRKTIYVAVPGIFAGKDVLTPLDLQRILAVLELSNFDPGREEEDKSYYMYRFDETEHLYIRDEIETFLVRNSRKKNKYSYRHDNCLDILMGGYGSDRIVNRPVEYVNRVRIEDDDDFYRITINTVSPALRIGKYEDIGDDYVRVLYKDGARMQFNMTSYRITINCKTGFTYFFKPLTSAKCGRFQYRPMPRIVNATALLAGKRCDRHVRKYKQILGKSFVKRILNEEFGGDFNKYAFAMRYPFTLTETGFVPAFRLAVRGITRDMSPSDIYQKMALNLNMKNTPSFRRIMTDTDMIGKVSFMRYLGFTDQNIIFNAATGKGGMRVISCGHSCHEEKMKKARAFFRDVIKNRGEAAASKFLIPSKGRRSILYDSIGMYTAYLEHDFEIPLTGSLLEIHDRMAFDWRKLRQQNVAFDYTDKQKALKADINGCEFFLPGDAYELIDAGNLLSNCVGSYSGSIRNNNCTIVLVRQEGRLTGCIEVSPGGSIRQAYAHHNTEMTGSLKEAYEIWLKQKDLNDRAESSFIDDLFELPFELPV